MQTQADTNSGASWTAAELCERLASALAQRPIEGVEELARCDADTLRRYTELGILDPPVRDGGGAAYGPRHLRQLLGIISSRRQGLSLETLRDRHDNMIELQRALAAGDADALLAAAERRAGLPGPRQWVIFKAMALSMKGRWQEALDELAGQPPDDMPIAGAARDHWRFGHYNAQFDCLLHLDLARARQVYERHLAPMRDGEVLGQAARLVDTCLALLRCYEGDHASSRPALQALVASPQAPAVSRAHAHLLLGRIAAAAGDRAGAAAERERARAAGAGTWIAAAAERDGAEQSP